MIPYRRPAALLLAGLLAACGSTPATQYFTLPDSTYLPPAGSAERATAVRVLLAPPLEQGGLVYQTSPLQVNFARRNLWAVPLDQSLAAAFSNRLNRLSGGHFAPYGHHRDGSGVLTIRIEQFQGTFQGHTLVSGYARWPDGRTRPFDIRTPQQGDGYPAMVESLSQGLGQAAEAILR